MSLVQRIETLRKRHAQLEHMLHEEEHRPLPDFVKVHKYKREKLMLNDHMHSLARERGVAEVRQSTG